MLAIDTNVVVRYLTGDDPAQAARARALIDSEAVFVATTVLLETEWVLRSVYGIDGIHFVEAVRAFAGLPQVTLEEAALAARALEWAEQGLDFADALHLAKAADCEALATFDGSFAAAARRIGALEIRRL